MHARAPATIACLVLGSWAASLACAPRPSRAAGPGVLLIAIDGLRADHLSCAGYDRPTTPALDALAGQGYLFRQAFSAAPWLLPAHVALITGCDPNVARLTPAKDVEIQVVKSWRIHDRVPHLAVEFLGAGYATAAFSDHPWLAPVYGFAPGFQVFDTADRPEEQGLAAARVRLEQWLSRLDPGEGWFAYLHVHDLERIWQESDPRRDTYFAPRAGMEQVPPVASTEPVFFAIPPSRWDGGAHSLGEYEARYDGALRELDLSLGELFESLRARGRFDETNVVVVGTHGLQFGEAGLILDHGCLSVADLHVPWILKPAGGGLSATVAIDAVASTIDVAPTLLELCRLAIPSGTHGVSQLPAMHGTGPAPRDHAIATGGFQQGYAFFGRAWCLETLYPTRVAAASLVRSWYGTNALEDLEPLVLETFYDRYATPHPVIGKGALPEPGVLDRLRATSHEWVGNILALRAYLHGPDASEEAPSPATVRRLIDQGYLADDGG